MKQHDIRIKDTLGNYITLNKGKSIELREKIISSTYERALRYVSDALFHFYYSNTQINTPVSVTKYQLLFLNALLKNEHAC